MRVFLKSTSFRLFLIVCFFNLMLSTESSAENNHASVSNIRFEQLDERVIITYDLSGNSSNRYDVSILLKKKSDPSFGFEPKLLTGNIGGGIACGENLAVVWSNDEEIPDDLRNGDYYFVGYASEVEESSISPWIWIGAVLIVGGIVYLIVSKSKEETPNEFPTPPGRPN
ncbi:MAG: hypothetical protein HYZ34_04000 [Ignavibacteriae bacterium]|nr:hypothetical protein [Ignavibacteriota bacterium]